MSVSSMRGIFLSVLIFSISLVLIPNVYAESINAKSIALEETTIIEFTNDGTSDVNSFRIWLSSDFNFKSFKTEKGWTGEKTPQGVIIFTSSESVKPGESIKFGVKTDKVSSGINWKAIDAKDNEIDSGKSIAGDLPEPKVNSKPETKTSTSDQGILSESVFRIIPEKPNVGATIRVTGDEFGASQEFDFYIDSNKIGSFETDDKGHFITTMKIPDNTNADRVDFLVKDKKGEEKKVSLRLGGIESRIPDAEHIELTISGIPDIIHRGETLEISGTGQPRSAVTAKIQNPSGETINTRTAEIDSTGKWALKEPVLVPLDAPFGKYTAEISDGRTEITREWKVETNKVIMIEPESLKFDPGEIMKYNGTAIPDIPIELVLEDPLGNERSSDVIDVDSSGFVEFEYKTTANVDKEGTWTLIASQNKNTEFIYAGLGQLPVIPINLDFDKLNYKSSETATITITGKPSESLSMLIIDPSDKQKGETIPIKLKPDGRNTYELDLEGYSSGVYTAVISKGAAKSSEIFTVGLQTGSGEIKLSTTKLEYQPGDAILLLGDTNPNVLLTVVLLDPNGNEVKSRETFSNKNGKISEGSFRVPTEAVPGIWQLKAISGSNYAITDFGVTKNLEEGMVVSVEKGEDIPGLGKTITIKVIGAASTVQIDIISDEGIVIDHLEFPASSGGEINQPWIIPKDTEPGEYKVIAKDAKNTDELIFTIE